MAYYQQPYQPPLPGTTLRFVKTLTKTTFKMNELINNNFNEIFNLLPENLNKKQRLDVYLAENIANLSRSKAKNLIENGSVVINGAVCQDPSSNVRNFMQIEVTLTPRPPTNMVKKEIDLNIVYEDEHLLVINKPAGLTVHPGAGNYQDTLANGLLYYLDQNLSKVGGETRPGIVHRLDKDTSGLMVVAKNDFAHNFLQAQLKSRELKRIYNAIVFGVPTPSAGTITTYLARSDRDRTKMAVARHGKEAITDYKLLKSFKIASLVECSLKTGRTHQIRVHMTHIGHNLVGDQVYGNNKRKFKDISADFLHSFPRQALHAKSIEFIHPFSKDKMQFESELAMDMKGLLDELNVIV